MYDFLASFGMHDTCMCVLGSLAISGMGRVAMFFNLALLFPDIHGVIGFSCFGFSGFQDGFKAEWGGLRINHKA